MLSHADYVRPASFLFYFGLCAVIDIKNIDLNWLIKHFFTAHLQEYGSGRQRQQYTRQKL